MGFFKALMSYNMLAYTMLLFLKICINFFSVY